jgi:hypothetical protein
MALIKFGGGITEMRGSMGGNTYSRNRMGAYLRARTKPVNPNTDRQAAVRAAMALLTDRWGQVLTALQRTAWNLYGANVVMTNKLAESINLTGFNHYIRSNQWLARVGAPTIDPGPTVFEIPTADPLFAVTISEATNTWTVTFDDGMDWVSEDGAQMIMYNGSPQNAQRNFFGGPWRFMNSIAGNNGAPPASPLDRGASFVYTEGQHAWCYARIMRADGRLSAPFRADTFVTA